MYYLYKKKVKREKFPWIFNMHLKCNVKQFLHMSIYVLIYNKKKYLGENWFGVSLDKFASCESNLAANRQTRMLADLALVGCYNKSVMPPVERDRVMLASAKRNLAAMSYFGLTRYQKVRLPTYLIVFLCCCILWLLLLSLNLIFVCSTI